MVIAMNELRVLRGRRGVVRLLGIALLLCASLAVEAQRPRVGLVPRRVAAKLAADAGAPNQRVAPNQQRNGAAEFSADEVAMLPRGLGVVQMRALIRVLRRLDLTAEQRQKLRDISSRYGNQLPVLTRLFRAQNEALDEAIYSQNFDPKVVEQRAAEAGATQAEITKVRAKIMSELRQTLLPEQSAKFRQLIEQERLRILQENRAAAQESQQ